MPFTRSRVRGGLLFILALGSACEAANGVMPVDDTEIILPNGYALSLKRVGAHAQNLTMRRKDERIWSKRYEEEYDRLWDWAFFVPVVPGRYAVDLDGDGSVEVGIATWDGGNNIANRDALVFSIHEDGPRYRDRRKFNLEFGKSVYPY